MNNLSNRQKDIRRAANANAFAEILQAEAAEKLAKAAKRKAIRLRALKQRKENERVSDDFFANLSRPIPENEPIQLDLFGGMF